MFIDKTDIILTAGSGGAGCISFRREKYVPYGGPNGGNGGNGGNIYFEGDPHKNTLLDLSHQHSIKAQDGVNGSSNTKNGKFGADLIIKVPLGTVIFKNDELFADIKKAGERILIVKGGRGGRGNASFKTLKHTAPRIAEKGEPGEKALIRLELRLIADVGFVGMPNAGKSTLLARITAAKPKIADYPFTTLVPNLGIVNFKGRHFAAADIPGIIEGAHQGKGLGFEFLRHIRRTKVLLHIIDMSGFDGKDPYENYKAINDELKKYSKLTAKKPIVIVLNKKELPSSQENIKAFKRRVRKKPLFEISAVTGEGIDEMLAQTVLMLDKPTEPDFEEEIVPVRKYTFEPEFKVYKKDGIFIAEGKKIETLTRMTKLNEDDALRRYQNILKKMGLETELEKMGAKIGDTVRICDFEFTFEK
jgi:GTP-binding protein